MLLIQMDTCLLLPTPGGGLTWFGIVVYKADLSITITWIQLKYATSVVKFRAVGICPFLVDYEKKAHILSRQISRI